MPKVWLLHRHAGSRQTSARDQHRGFGVGCAIEFDGPSHFWACKARTGATFIKRRHLELIGYILVSGSYWEWEGLSGMDERRKYLEGKLQCNVGVWKSLGW